MNPGVFPGACLAGYCFGCIDMAWILAFARGKDIKAMGNGNPGASNALMTMGPRAGIVTGAWDIGKALLAGLFASAVLGAGPDACMAAAGAAVIGHVFPFWLDFRGGKGFAPFVGFMLRADPLSALVLLAIGALAGLVSDRIVAMTFLCAVLEPAALALRLGPAYGLAALPLTALLLLRHRQNMKNIMDGTEPSIRKAFRGSAAPEDE